MKKILLTTIMTILLSNAYGQIFTVETIQENGDPNKLINLVIMGDGYTASEQSIFLAKATQLSNYLFSQSPWSNYKNYFNVYAIDVISAESGAKHPNTASDCPISGPNVVPISNPNTYFGCSFDQYGVHRLIVPTNFTNIANVLATNFPNYDQAIILANTPYYGGSGGEFSTLSTNIQSNEIGAHEMGHSFAGLADEYYAGDVYFAEKPNMTAETDLALIKWKNWLNINQVGAYSYCCGGNSSLWRKPVNGTCKMEYLNNQYCSVCQEGIVERIHSLTNPIVSYLPIESTINTTNPTIDFTLTQVIKPIPNTLNIKWELDGTIISPNSELVQINQTTLSVGEHILTATVTDNATLTHITNHETIHFNTVTWTINRSALGASWQTKEATVGLTIFPNPSNDFVNVKLDLIESADVSIDVVAMDGRVIRSIASKRFAAGENNALINTADLSRGTYSITLKINGVNYSKMLIKE